MDNLGRHPQNYIEFVWNFATFARLPFGQPLKTL